MRGVIRLDGDEEETLGHEPVKEGRENKQGNAVAIGKGQEIGGSLGTLGSG